MLLPVIAKFSTADETVEAAAQATTTKATQQAGAAV